MYKDALQDFAGTAKGVNGIIFLDAEGEAIEFAGTISDYDLKIIGAHFSVFFNTVNGFDQQPDSMFITTGPYVIGMYRLSKEYFLLVLYLSDYHTIINRSRLMELIHFIKGSL
jgi:predicted regulator of Ras-like GTPase activity (Roadblock/LC7/MglB family)